MIGRVRLLFGIYGCYCDNCNLQLAYFGRPGCYELRQSQRGSNRRLYLQHAHLRRRQQRRVERDRP